MTYNSRSAQILRAGTATSPVVWSPEAGWADSTAHHHYYRHDVSDWWCRECDTVTDYCTDDTTDGGE